MARKLKARDMLDEVTKHGAHIKLKNKQPEAHHPIRRWFKDDIDEKRVQMTEVARQAQQLLRLTGSFVIKQCSSSAAFSNLTNCWRMQIRIGHDIYSEIEGKMKKEKTKKKKKKKHFVSS